MPSDYSTSSASVKMQSGTPTNNVALPAHYVRIPRSLICQSAYHTLPIGVYGLIGRLWLLTGQAVPLSAADIARFDSTISQAAAQRALTWLIEHGWLIADGGAGRKANFAPTWGNIKGVPLSWKAGENGLGRPRHIKAAALDTRLFDVYMGRVTPRPSQRTALIERYLTAPAISLADVGCYAGLLHGIGQATPALERYGLAHACSYQRLPATNDALLRGLSQHAMLHGGPALTAQGLRALGLTDGPTRHDASPTSANLLFLPKDQIGNLIGNQIGNLVTQTADQQPSNTAVESVKTVQHQPRQHIPLDGIQNNRKTTPSSGGDQSCCAAPKIHVPENETTRRLAAYQVIPRYQAAFADVSPDVVEYLIRCADQGDHVRSKAGYVVWALGQYQQHGYKPPIPTRPGLVDWAAERHKYEASDMVVSAPMIAHVDMPAPTSHPATPFAQTPMQAMTDTEEIPSPPTDDPVAALRAALRARVPRQHVPLVQRLTIELDQHCVITVDSAQERNAVAAIEQHINWSLDDLALPSPARIVCRERASAAPPAPHVSPAPDWLDIEAADWQALPVLLRIALSRATYADGQICGANQRAQQIIDDHRERIEAMVLRY